MILIRIEKEAFESWKSQIEELFNSSVKMNFASYPIKASYGKEKCEEVIRYLQDGSAIVFAAIERRKMYGWVWCHEINRLGKRRLHIAEIAVFEEFQHQGIGGKLLNMVEEYAVEHDISEIDLFVTLSNKSAVLFYEKTSYEPERCLMKKKLK